MNDCFQILSLDGGGIKGLFSAVLLAKLEEDLKIKVIDHFDLIVGTSTGGIIALGLGLGMTPKEIVDFYLEKGPRIFAGIPVASWFKHILFNKYDGKILEDILKDDKCFGSRLLGESKKRLVIPSFDTDSGEVYIFKTAHHERFKRDFKYPAWKVARATTAAPSFFPTCKCIDNISLVDGGLWANNPSMIGLVEAIKVLEITIDTIKILNIGTTEELSKKSFVLKYFGGWLPRALPAIKTILQAQSSAVCSQCKLLIKDHYVRISPKVPEGLFKLDKLNMQDLYAFASKHSRDNSPIFENVFSGHKSGEFVPIHKI